MTESASSWNREDVACAVVVSPSEIPPLMPSEEDEYLKALKAAKERIERCKMSHTPQHIGISFNGGKDSVVMFELLLEVLGEAFVTNCRLFMFGEDDEFVEMKKFRESYIAKRVPAAKLVTVPAEFGIKDGLQHLKCNYSLEAVFLGTRRDDPSAKYQRNAVEETTSGWPLMVRFCPVFDFSYHGVWRYLAVHRLPVCSLYADGYTSLGRTSLTVRNPSCLVVVRDNSRGDGGGGPCDNDTTLANGSSSTNTAAQVSYRPAWLLEDGSKERDGRLSKSGL